jgi:hypothetical protein
LKNSSASFFDLVSCAAGGIWYNARCWIARRLFPEVFVSLQDKRNLGFVDSDLIHSQNVLIGYYLDEIILLNDEIRELKEKVVKMEEKQG